MADEEYTAYVEDLAALRRLVTPPRDAAPAAGRTTGARRRRTPK
jgi:hypothetical protein